MPLPTLGVKNGAGADVTINTPASARQAAADSQAVVLSTEDFAALGAVTETAPATDTASSGLNGRLQRIAQRLTSLIALLPASLGGKTAAGSLSVTLATDHAALPLPTGAATETTLAAINTKLPASPATDRTTAAAPFAVRLTDGSAFIATLPVSIASWTGLTDTQLRASAVAVSLASVPLPSGASTSANQSTANTSLASIDGKLPALVSSRVPVQSSIPAASSGTILSLQTASTGTSFTAFASQACTALDIVNNTGTTIEYRRGAAGTAMQIPTGAARMVIGITNANQIDIRRTDTSNTQVTLQAEAFA